MRIESKLFHPSLLPLAKIYTIFLVLLAVLVATAIYWREDEPRSEISYFSVLLWQLAIWLPWLIALPVIRYLLLDGPKSAGSKEGVFQAVILVVMVVLHWGWFYSISDAFSPYLGYPHTAYGVYPYFFIFWILIDIVLLWSLFQQMNAHQAKIATLDRMGSLERESIKSGSELPSKITVKKGNATVVLSAQEINWVSAEDYYARLYTVQGEYLLRQSLSKLLADLPSDEFIKIHRSTLVHIDYISELRTVDNGGLEVLLKDGNVRKVSRSAVKGLKQRLATNMS